MERFGIFSGSCNANDLLWFMSKQTLKDKGEVTQKTHLQVQFFN